MMLRSDLTICVVVIAMISSARADLMTFTDQSEWEAAVDAPITTIDFTGYEDHEFITDQYIDLGIEFTDGDDNFFLQGQFHDNWGVDGNESTEIVYSEPQTFVAALYPTALTFNLYSDDEFVGAHSFDGGAGDHFAGIISDSPFNRLVFEHPLSGHQVRIDDLFIQTIPAPGVLPLLGLGVLFIRRRRRRR